ncbi:regulatory protein GemA [Pararoseomonas sp. SCSIO 73927]|uniref:regulatory protein GemA n=1 Tax=Pararoseomonas sp. SCSIO 73927 TaxID=3114537 RepID=UPI0030D254F6
MTDRMASGRMPRLAHARPPEGSARGADPKVLIAKIHVAKKQLGLTDDSYRDLLRRLIGQETSKGASASQLDRVLQEFKRLGFTATKGRPDHRRQIRMIVAVWADLRPYREEVENEEADRAALRAFVRRQTGGVDDVQFLTPELANKVLEGLKAWLSRAQRQVVA